MFMLKYKSSAGEYVIGGGQHPIANVVAIDGFGLPPRTYETVEFAGENGVTEIGRKDGQRVLTISGTVRGDWREVQKIQRIFYEDGELFCWFDGLRRRIPCKLNKFDAPKKKHKSDLHSFVVQLSCDYPYFLGFITTSRSLFDRRNNIEFVNTQFTLPAIFTTRSSGGNAFNDGDKNVYPKIEIINLTGSDKTIILRNATTNVEVKFKSRMLKSNETLTFDFAERIITSSIDGDVTSKLDNASANLSAFYLQRGKNVIVVDGVTDGQINARIEFTPEYLSATR